MRGVKTVFVQNIIAPYKSLLFNVLAVRGRIDFEVLYLSESEAIRDWRVDRNDLRFRHSILVNGKWEQASRLAKSLAIWSCLEKMGPDVVVVGGYSYLAFWVAAIWARTHGKRLILINESQEIDHPRSHFTEWTKTIFVGACDAALVDGTRHKDYTIKLGMKPDRIFVKYGTGPIAVDWYAKLARAARADRRSICARLGQPLRNFLYVGRLAPEKNLPRLIEAFAVVHGCGDQEWGLILVGDGPARGAIEKKVSEMRLENVLMPGFKQKEDLPLFYGISDVFILPSLSEPWGLVVCEAMASGLPVIVSNRCGCLPDAVIEGQNGYSFEPESTTELQEKMLKFVRATVNAENMGTCSKKLVQKFRPEHVAEAYELAITQSFRR